MTCWTAVPSPVGELLLATDGEALTHVLFERHREGTDPLLERVRSTPRDDEHPVLRLVAAQLAEYFDRRRTGFELPLAPHGSGFQQRVWTALLGIPYGETVSYGEIARRLDLPPGASRAVGLANGANPISIVVPCHRVIGANKTLTGYGGGLPRKKWLLEHEGVLNRGAA